MSEGKMTKQQAKEAVAEQAKAYEKLRSKMRKEGALTDSMRVIELFAAKQCPPDMYNDWRRLAKWLKTINKDK